MKGYLERNNKCPYCGGCNCLTYENDDIADIRWDTHHFIICEKCDATACGDDENDVIRNWESGNIYFVKDGYAIMKDGQTFYIGY